MGKLLRILAILLLTAVLLLFARILWMSFVYPSLNPVSIPKNVISSQISDENKTAKTERNTRTKKQTSQANSKKSVVPVKMENAQTNINVANSLQKVYAKVKKITENINFPRSYYTEKQINRVLFSLRECKQIPKATVFTCMKCHGEYGEKAAMGVSKPIILMSAKEIYHALKKYQTGKENRYGKGSVMHKVLKRKQYSDCDLKSLANQVKGL